MFGKPSKFNGQVYKQRSGGPIGDNATNDAADVVMWIFITHYKRSLSRLGISKETVLLKVYVDDLNQAGLRLPYGTQYIRGRLYIPGRGWSGRAPDGQAITKEEKKEIEETAQRLAMEARPPDQEEAVVLSKMTMTNLFIQLQDGDLQNLTIMMNHF